MPQVGQVLLIITVCLVNGNEFTEATSGPDHGPDEPLPSEAEFRVGVDHAQLDPQLDLSGLHHATTPGPPCKRVVEAAGTDLNLKDMYLPPGVHACVAQPTGPDREQWGGGGFDCFAQTTVTAPGRRDVMTGSA
jgi:hypothetical protein